MVEICSLLAYIKAVTMKWLDPIYFNIVRLCFPLHSVIVAAASCRKDVFDDNCIRL